MNQATTAQAPRYNASSQQTPPTRTLPAPESFATVDDVFELGDVVAKDPPTPLSLPLSPPDAVMRPGPFAAAEAVMRCVGVDEGMPSRVEMEPEIMEGVEVFAFTAVEMGRKLDGVAAGAVEFSRWGARGKVGCADADFCCFSDDSLSLADPDGGPAVAAAIRREGVPVASKSELGEVALK